MKKDEIIDKIKKLNSIKISDINLGKTKLKKRDNRKQDFNFFEPYIGKSNEEKNQHLYIAGVAATLTLFFVGASVWNSYRVTTVAKEVESIKSQIESPQTKTKLEEVEKLKKKYTVINKYYGQAYSISNAINNKDVISSVLIGKVFSQIPQTVSFKSFDVTVGEKGVGGTIDVQAIAESRTSIAELEHNLKSVDSIKEVQVNNITEVNNVVESNLNVNLNNSSSYTFSIKCTLKDVDNDEAK